MTTQHNEFKEMEAFNMITIEDEEQESKKNRVIK